MSIKLCQATGSTVTPLDDARLYSWIANRAVGIVTGCTVTSAGTNQLSIAAGWGVCQGHMFTISAETIGAVLATSGTLPGRLLIHIDTADTDMPVKFVTQAASILPALTQEDIDGSGSIYEIPLATYTAGTISISDLTSAAPAAPSLQSEIDSLNASCAQLSQNLAKVTHIPVNLPMNLPPVTAVSVDVSFGTTYEKPPIVSIGSLIVVNGSAYPITQNIVGVTTSGVTIQFGNFHQSTTYQANITGYIEVVES